MPLTLRKYFYIDIFPSCNLRCPSCIVGIDGFVQEHGNGGMMSPSFLEAIVDKALSECVVTGVGLYNWTEPMLHPELPDLIGVLRRRGIHSSLSSNLNILRDADAVMAAGPDRLRVSVSGFTQECYAKGHRRGDVERVKANMIRLAEAKARLGSRTALEVFFHRYRDNQAELAPMEAFAHGLGYEFLSAPAYITPVERILRLHAEPGAATAPEREVLERLSLPLDVALSVTAAHPRTACPFQDEQVCIGVDGTVILCCASSPSETVGQFLDLPLAEIESRKRSNPLCGPCMAVNLPDYFLGRPEFTALELGRLEQG